MIKIFHTSLFGTTSDARYWWEGEGLLFPQEQRNYIGFINYNDVCYYFFPISIIIVYSLLGAYRVPKVSYSPTIKSRNNWKRIIFVLSELVSGICGKKTVNLMTNHSGTYLVCWLLTLLTIRKIWYLFIMLYFVSPAEKILSPGFISSGLRLTKYTQRI